MGIAAEFARYGAKLTNVQWAVSSLTGTELVASLWYHRIRVSEGKWVYRDHLGRWSGHGNKLFADHLAMAVAESKPVRIVVAKTSNVDLIENGGDGSKAKNTFKARPEWVGRVTEFDGDHFTMIFEKTLPQEGGAV